jgi:hypothetical protein
MVTLQQETHDVRQELIATIATVTASFAVPRIVQAVQEKRQCKPQRPNPSRSAMLPSMA